MSFGDEMVKAANDERRHLIKTHAHQGRYICGYCRKETPIEDDVLIRVIDGQEQLSQIKPICLCGHFSYASSIRFQSKVDPKDWRFAVGSCE